MKKFIAGMVIGSIIGVTLNDLVLVEAVIDHGIDITEHIQRAFERGLEDGKKINSWRRKYSTPEKRQ